ncbi:uncharacterized protein LOC141629620 [Silene latifolia]|uniref:uncharacterized protein LOC141629620 n=1 Tax=Silene latifolia TaxID=37657 RepID=UPI003D770663
MDCFAWSHSDMIGIDPGVITHKLSVDPSYKLVQQKRRKFASERDQVINQEVDNLLAAGKIQEVKYPKWLSNVVVVPKKNGKWRVSVDFTDLNKASPKYPFPLPHIDAMVDATAGSTYQRLVKMMFKEQIGQTMEVYIDDMVVKSKQAPQHHQHLAETFNTLGKYQMKLNPTKCTFGVSHGKFWGRMAKWSVHLSGHDLKFEPRTTIKSQAVLDFVSDFCPALQTQVEHDILNLEEDKEEQVWELHVDGTSNAGGAGVGLVLKSPQGDLIVQSVRCEFKATNNEEEYEVLLLGLKLALDLKIRHLKVCSDSKLIVNHVNDCYEARDSRMMVYLDVAKELTLRFATFNIKQIPRDQNAEADALATLGATFKAGAISPIPIVHILEPAILKPEQDAEVLCCTSGGEDTP